MAKRCTPLLVLLLVSVSLRAPAAEPAKLELKKGDHVCVIGNTLAERMQHDGWLETLIHARFPEHELVFRDLGYSADEVRLDRRLRSLNFGTPDEWLSGVSPPPHKVEGAAENRFALTNTKADVIFAFFGYNESFAGEAGLPAFKQDLDGMLKHMLSQKYNGKSAPRIVLFSPIPQGAPKGRDLPDPAETNKRLKLYADAMDEVAKSKGVMFIDLFTPLLQVFAGQPKPLTINGIHLTEQGNMVVAGMATAMLLGEVASPPTQLEPLRRAVKDKNWHWFHRYRTTDGYSNFGVRGGLTFLPDNQSNYVVLQRESEILDVMTANRDKRIWSVAQGKDPGPVDDSNTPAPVPVKTNKPGANPDGSHKFLKAEEAIGRMTVAEGLKVNLFASEEQFPELVEPVQMAFDTKGRLWVAAWATYPHFAPKQPADDKLLILEDTNNDGRADVCKTFVADLHNPTGFEFYNDGVIVSQGPDILFLKDADGDDKADVKERILHGMDTADTHHTANSFTFDPGGALYWQEGIFHHTQVETPYGPVRNIDAGVYRFEPRTRRFDVYVTYGFANPHGHVFDRWGQDFVTDGTGADTYWSPVFSGKMYFPDKHTRDPKPPKPYEQRTRPCAATEIVSSRHLPDEMQGNLLVLNVIGFQGILQYKFADKDSGFACTEVEPLVQSDDPNFRPADVEVGPDGAVYFVDWHNPIIGHMQHNLRDPNRDRTHGRVYRVTAEDRELTKPAKIAAEPVDKLLELLKASEDRVRYRTRIELGGRNSDEVISAVDKWLAALDTSDKEYEHHMMEGLWVHQWHNRVNADLLKRMLRSPDFRARAAATRVLCDWRDRVPDALALLKTQVNDEHPRVRLEAVRACSYFTTGQAAEVALESLNHPQDPFLEYTINETMKTLDRFQK